MCHQLESFISKPQTNLSEYFETASAILMSPSDSPRDSLEMGLMFLHITKAAKTPLVFGSIVRCQTLKNSSSAGKT